MSKESEKSEKALLSKYYKLRGDYVEVTLVYNTFSELIDSNFGDDRVEKLSNKLFDSIELAFKEIPVEYSILLNIKIKEFGNYNQDEAIKIIRENIEMRLHTINRTDKKKKFRSTLVMLVGLAFIIGGYFIPRLNATNIAYELVDLTGQVFVWEGMYAYFLDRMEDKFLTRQYRKKLHSIKISKYGEDTVMESISLKKPGKIDAKIKMDTTLPSQSQSTNSNTLENIINNFDNVNSEQSENQKIANIK